MEPQTDRTSTAPTRALPVGPGWRARRRPVPQLGHLLGAAGGALAVLAPIVFGGDAAAEPSGTGTTGAVLCVLAVAAALVAMHVAPGAVRAACTSVVAVGIPAFWVFALLVSDSPSRPTTVLFLVTSSYVAVWLVGPARGRGVILVLALLAAWNLAVAEVTDLDFGDRGTFASGSIIGTEPSHVPGILGVAVLPARHGSPPAEPAPVLPATSHRDDDLFLDDDPFFDDDPFEVRTDPFGPDAGEIGWTSVIFGAVYLLGAFLAGRRRLLGVLTPLLGVGVLALISGVVSLGIDTERAWLFGLLLLLAGAGIGYLGSRGAYRATLWIGAAAVAVGAGFIIGDIAEGTSDELRLFSLLALIAGTVIAAAGWWVAERERERPDGEPDGEGGARGTRGDGEVAASEAPSSWQPPPST